MRICCGESVRGEQSAVKISLRQQWNFRHLCMYADLQFVVVKHMMPAISQCNSGIHRVLREHTITHEINSGQGICWLFGIIMALYLTSVTSCVTAVSGESRDPEEAATAGACSAVKSCCALGALSAAAIASSADLCGYQNHGYVLLSAGSGDMQPPLNAIHLCTRLCLCPT